MNPVVSSGRLARPAGIASRRAPLLTSTRVRTCNAFRTARSSRQPLRVVAAMSGGGGKSPIEKAMKYLEDLVFKLSQRAKSKPTDRFSAGKSGLEAYQGGAGKPPAGGGGGDPWGSGGQPEEPDDRAFGLKDLQAFLKEWGEYGATILVFLVAYQMLWPIAQWFEKIQESPRSIIADIQQLFANIRGSVEWVIGWAPKPENQVVVDDDGSLWVNAPLCLAASAPVHVDVPGYDPEPPLAFDTLKYPNLTAEEQFALTNYYASRPWERADPFEVDPQWVRAIEDRLEPGEADRRRFLAAKAAGKEAEYWASRRIKHMDKRTGVWETVSEDYDPQQSELERMELDVNRQARAVGLPPVDLENARWTPAQVEEFERRFGKDFLTKKR